MKYSISIPLNDEVLFVAQECQKRLHKLMGINYIMKNSFPHIDIISGSSYSIDKIISVTKKIKLHKKKIDLFGLGVFLTPKPLIYLRFKKSSFINKLRHSLLEDTKGLWESLSATVSEDIWTPKSTLAYNDLPLEKLSDALVCLNGIDLIKSMDITELAIIDFTKGERQVELVKL